MARRARRAGPAGTRKSWDQLAIDTRRRLARKLEAAADQVVKDLIEIGPAYSGEFSESWVVLNLDGSQPKFSYAKNSKDLRFGVEIVNTAPHAAVAMDLEPGVFITPDYDPIKQPVETGRRVGRMRGDVIPGEGKATSTAVSDWYTTYAQGGEFTESVKVGASTMLGVKVK